MLVVRNKDTGRLVYRQEPEPKDVGKLLAIAIMQGLGDYSNLEEYEATQEEWDREVALRQAEKPKDKIQALQEEIEALKKRVSDLELP